MSVSDAGNDDLQTVLQESEVMKSKSAVDMKDFDVQEESGDNHEVSNEILDLTEVLVDENMEEKAFDMQNQVLTNKGANDLGANLSLSDIENSSELLKLEIEKSLNVDMDLDSEEKATTDMKTDVIESEEKQFDTLRAQVQQVRYIIYLNFGILLVYCIVKLIFLLAFGCPAYAVSTAFMVLIIKYNKKENQTLISCQRHATATATTLVYFDDRPDFKF